MCYSRMLWLFAVVLLAAAIPANAGKCMKNVDLPGFTVPKGDISVQYGTPLKILCVLDPEHNETIGANASDIRFERLGVQVPSEYVQVLNATAAQLYMEHAHPAENTNYFCKLKPKGRKTTFVCVNRVAIGYPPSELKIENFTCLSRHLRNLNCTWKVPENTVRTTYTISYMVGPPETRYVNSFPCPDMESPNFGYCYWDDATNPTYREKDDIYYFRIYAENAFGNVTFKDIVFNQFAHVLPEKPEYLNGSEITTNSVLLHWRIDPHLKSLPLKYRLQYKSEKSECDLADEWKVMNTSHFDKRTTSFNLTDLPYANFLYDVRLYIAPELAEGDDLWSEPATYTFRTKPTPPASPPQVAPGSFLVSGRETLRDVFIFWKRLLRCEENGDDFRYKVVAKELNGSQVEIVANTSKSSFAKFANLSLNAYEISVFSSNKEGTSKRAVVVVPEKRHMPPQPSRITKYIRDKGVIQLTWSKEFPEVWADKIKNFTVFWCQNEQYSKIHCTGLLNSKVVSKEVAETTIQTEPGKLYEFGVATNTATASSGIAWVTCTLRSDNDFSRVSMLQVRKTADTFVEVYFKVECVTGLRRARYDVHYCPGDLPEKPEQCKEPSKIETVLTYGTEVVVKVSGLRPYTRYWLWVVPVGADGRAAGDRSEVAKVTTLDTNPSPPRNLTVYNVTGDSARVRWLPPEAMNGVLQHYIVHYGDRELKVPLDQGTDALLTGLDGDSEYSVSVVACGKGCTPAEEPAALRTRIGRPGAVLRPAARLQDASTLLLRWTPPQPPGGPTHTYEALVVTTSSGHNFTVPLSPSSPTNLTATVRFSACDSNPYASYSVFVRAANMDENNNTLIGPWSEPIEAYCGSGTGSLAKGRVLLWCVGTLAVLASCAGLVYGGRRFARWWHRAKDVRVKLPPGLANAAANAKHADKRDLAEDRRVRTPWLLYGGDKGGGANGAEPPDSPTHEETTLLRAGRRIGGGVERCDSGGSSAGSDCALSSFTSTTTAASDSDADHQDHHDSNESASKPRAARQWSTFSDGSVSRSTPNLWEAEHTSAVPPLPDRPPGYCRAGLAPGYVAVASMPYVRRGSLDGWPPTSVATGYMQMSTNNELVPAAELKTAPTRVTGGGPTGYVPHSTAPLPSKDELLRGLISNAVPYVTAAKQPLTTPQHAMHLQHRQGTPAMWPSIRCEMPVAPSSPMHRPTAATRGYVSVDDLPAPTPASSQHDTAGASAEAGYVVCSTAPAPGATASGRPPDGYVAAGPAPAAQTPTSTPSHHCKPGAPYVMLGEAPAPVQRPAAGRGYVSLQQLERT